MNEKTAKEMIELMAKKWSISDHEFLCNFISEEKKRTSGKDFEFDEFEFSFVGKTKTIRISHLCFPNARLSQEKREELNKGRITSIVEAINQIVDHFKLELEKGILSEVLHFAKLHAGFPFQIGLAYQAEMKIKLKLYVCVNGQNFPLRDFCSMVGLNYESIHRVLKGRLLDTVAVDLTDQNKFSFKFYTLNSKGGSNGSLIRISDSGQVLSEKAWVRFSGGVSLEKFLASGFMEIPAYLRGHMEKNGVVVSYLCQENQERSFYCR